jgi:outer membrane protein assembly factor BamB
MPANTILAPRLPLISTGLFLVVGALIAPAQLQAGEISQDTAWPRFRGANGTGISQLTGVPVQWTAVDYEWVVDLPGVGHSSPVVWGNRLFVASGTDDGTRTLICVDALQGDVLWQQSVKLDPNHLHKKNSYGSGSPAVDGERVYVAFADQSHNILYTYDLSGSLLWTADLGTFESQHGQGQSPIIVGDRVILANDQDQVDGSSIVAFNKRTGEELWRSPRKSRETSYSTPMVLELPGKQPMLVCASGVTGVTALDLETGRELWSTGEFPQRTVASPVYGHGVILVSCGQGGRGVSMVAVEPSGSKPAESFRVRWPRTTNLPYVPTPIVWGEHLYLWTDEGIVCCVDPSNGETLQRRRVGGNFSSSPILIDGKLYGVSETGDIIVLAASPELTELGRSPLGDQSYSTPAVANGRVYFRGFQKLACLKAEAIR